MSFRFGALGATALAVVLGGCATAGNGPAAPAATDFAGELPEWAEELPEGTPPRDNAHTNEATLFLVQAQGTQDPEQRAQRYEQALSAAQAGIDADPENPQSYYHAGEALFGLERYEEGARMLDRAEEIYPRYVLETIAIREDAWLQKFNEGVQALEAEDWEEGMRRFEEAHTIYQDRPEAVLNLGHSHLSRGNHEEAVEWYRTGVEIVDGPWAERVDDELRASWEESRDVALNYMGQLLLRLERYDEAAEVYGRLAEQDPENLEALSGYAAALVAAGESERAMVLFDELMAQPGLTPADYYTIAVGLYQVDEFEQSARAFQAVTERVPEHRDAVFNLAQTLYLAEMYDELVEVTEHLVRIDPYNENAYRFRAQALVRIGEEQAAMEAWEEMEGLPFTVDDMQLQPGQRDMMLVGQITNRARPAGSSVRLRLHFFNDQGQSLGTQDTTVDLPAEGEAAIFQVQAPSDGTLFGYRYEVLG